MSNLFGHFHVNFWELVGLTGQSLFTARFVVQWLASEKKKESVVPVAFWYFSLIGGTVSFIYAVGIGSLSFSLGQGTGLFIYMRNLYLIHKKRATAPPAD